MHSESQHSFPVSTEFETLWIPAASDAFPKSVKPAASWKDTEGPVFRHIMNRVSEAFLPHDSRVTVSAVENLVATTHNATEALQDMISGGKDTTRLFFFLAIDPDEATQLRQHKRPIQERLRVMNTMTEDTGPDSCETDVMHLVVVLRSPEVQEGKGIPATATEMEIAQDIHILHFPRCTGSSVFTVMLSMLEASQQPSVSSEIHAIWETHRVAQDHSVTLVIPPTALFASVQDHHIGHQKAALDTKLVRTLEEYCEQWIVTLKAHLDARAVLPDPRQVPDDVGPQSEVERCESDLLVVESFLEQLDHLAVRLAVSLLTAAKSPSIATLLALRARLNAEVTTIKEVLRYLHSLSKHFDIMHRGDNSKVREMLPAFMQNIFLVSCASPESYTDERLTVLFVKVANQLIANCKTELRGSVSGKEYSLWDAMEDGKAEQTLLHRLRGCVTLCNDYSMWFHKAREGTEKSITMVRPLKLDDLLIFGKLQLFSKRIQKVIDIFTAIELFRTIREYHLAGFDTIGAKFFLIVEDFKRKCMDLLDYTKPSFDREYVEFSNHIVELENAVLLHINKCFESTTSTLVALDILARFKKVFCNNVFRLDFTSKGAVILHHYSIELEKVRQVYEREKEAPPTIRNAPTVVGPVLWARHLLRLIELPMSRLQSLGILESNPKESKRVIRNYNLLANALAQYELLWVAAWSKHVDVAKAGLDATLLTQHNGLALCNFDKLIFEVTREAKWLRRLGISLPPSAKSVLVQEGRIRSTERAVRGLLQAYNDTLAMVHPVMRALLYPCMTRLRELLTSGETVLLWTSTAAVDFCATVLEEVNHLRRVALRINDVLENRVQGPLRALNSLVLIDLLEDTAVSIDQYIVFQQKYITDRLVFMQHKSKEIELAVVEACAIARETYLSTTKPRCESASNLIPRRPSRTPQPGSSSQRSVPTPTTTNPRRETPNTIDADGSKVLMHFNRLMFKSVLHAVTTTFQRLRHRIITSATPKIPFLAHHYTPLFSTQLELHAPASVMLHPNVDEVQLCVNNVVKMALSALKEVGAWSFSLPESSHFYEEIARNKDVLKVVLFLTSSVQNLGQQVSEYLTSLARFQSLYGNDNKGQGGTASPPKISLTKWGHALIEEYVEVFGQYHEIESDLRRIPPKVDIGALSCDTTRYKKALLAEVNSCKQKLAVSLHTKADTELENLLRRLDATNKRLMHKITSDLSDVRIVFEGINEVRTMESSATMDTTPIEQMYLTLSKFEMKVNKDAHDKLTEFRVQWAKLRAMASERTQELCPLQVPLRAEFMDSVKRFGVDVLTFRNDFVANGPTVAGLKVQEALDRLKKYARLFGDKVRRWESLQVGEHLFGMPRKYYPELACTAKEIHLADRLYSLHFKVVIYIAQTHDTLWSELDYAGIKSKVQIFLAESRNMPPLARTWDIFQELKQALSDMDDLHLVIEQLKRPSIKDRHWNQIMEICGQAWKLDPEVFRLRHIVEAQILLHKDDVIELAQASDKENELEAKLRHVEHTWKEQILVCAEFKFRGAVVLKGDEVVSLKELLEETLLQLGGMMSSRYVGPFRTEVQKWIEKLTTVSEKLDSWMEVQSLWIYLEAVYSCGDIVKQLPVEAKRFSLIDKQWCKMMSKANEVRNVLNFCYGNEALKILPYLKEQLESLQRQLATYLEKKRTAFARFYFISDTVLLEILSQASDPAAIQSHLCSMFDGVQRVTLLFAKGGEPCRITKLHAPEGETVELYTPVPCIRNVEDWLQTLCSAMRTTIRYIMHAITADIGGPAPLSFRAMLKKYPAQVTMTASLMMWTADVTNSLGLRVADRREAIKRMSLVRDELTEIARGDLDAAQRTSVEGLVILQAHNMDVWESIKRCKDVDSFEFQRQLRAYWLSEKNDCIVRMTDVVLPYCYEYLGIKERLVMTSLTDRCYITLCQAIAIYMGGAPTGPAGTGKTETIKDLGRATGNYVVVFNCGDQLNFRQMGKIFKGLSQSGAWGCFDEFNRIELPVLSVVAQQILCMFTALKQRKAEFPFTDGSICKLVPTLGVFVTMNPGYAGRQELPENLKVLFRTVSMMVPERDAIMKVKLASAGYKSAATLSKKLFVLYAMCEHQLSRQYHYDFGLRNILSVLRSAGQGLRSSPSKDEEAVFVRTLQDMNMPKLVHADIDIFLALLNDVFPGKISDKIADGPFQRELRCKTEQLGYVVAPGWFRKCCQLNDTRKVRHGFMLVGGSGVGKTTGLKVTTTTLTHLERRHKELRMNPKAITAKQMFGRTDPVSGDWHDGIFSFLWRRANKDKTANVWIVCDGPVDTLWIENLNTVLDDNKLLTLANGDRLNMVPSVRICFEVEHLNHASPATVSRVGIIFFSEEELGWMTLPQTMLIEDSDDILTAPHISVTKGQRKSFLELYKQHVPEFITFMKLEVKAVMVVSTLHHVTNSLFTLADLMDQAKKLNVEMTPNLLEMMFWLALTWSFGALLETPERERFNEALVRRASKGAAWPIKDTIFEYKINFQEGTWQHWSTVLSATDPSLLPKTRSGSLNFTGLYISTLESVRLHAYLHSHVTQKRPVLIIGSVGCSKTVTIEKFLSQVTHGGGESGTMSWKKKNLSNITTPNSFQLTVEDVVEKRVGQQYGPKRNAFLLFFIDDVSSPEVNAWGDQETSELIRQMLEQGGLYSLARVGEWKQLVDLYFVAAMSHPGRGRNDIPNRLKRQFSIVNLPVASDEVLKQVYGTIIENRHGAGELTRNLTDLCIELWRTVQVKMLNYHFTMQKFHYQFDLRDLTRICQGLHLPPRSAAPSDTDNYSLWCHEVTRVLADKLNDEADLTWFRKQLALLLSKIVRSVDGAAESSSAARCAETYPSYVNFLRDVARVHEDDKEQTLIMYEPLESMAVAKDRLLHLLRQHNETFKQQRMDLVMFDAAVTHVLRLTRVLAMPQGSAVLVGVGGSGKQSIARLSAYVLGYPTFQPTVHNQYTSNTLLEDMRKQYIQAATRASCFLMSENDIRNEGFLEYINIALASGDVTGMFQPDEKDTACNEIHLLAKAESGKDYVDTDDFLWNYFIRKVRENLHFVLCFSPMGEKFRDRVRKFPSLMSCCTVDWFFPWPEEALLEVAMRFLNTCHIQADDSIKMALVSHFATCHHIADGLCEKYRSLQRRFVYSTPKSYLNFLELYKVLYQQKCAKLDEQRQAVNAGLAKLHDAAEGVTLMKIEITAKEVKLAAAREETEFLLMDITNQTAEAERTKAHVSQVKDQLAADAAKVEKGRAGAAWDLAQAEPALQAARAVLNSITANDMKLLKAMKRPPEMVRRIMDGVCLLLLHPIDAVNMEMSEISGKLVIQDSWINSGRPLVQRMDFMDLLMAFNVSKKENINDETCELLLPYLWDSNFHFERAKTACGNVAGLCTWVRAMYTYHNIAKLVAPKTVALHEAEDAMRVASNKLQTQEQQLRIIRQELHVCQTKLEDAKKRKQMLEDDAMRTRRRMETAAELLEALKGENARWNSDSKLFGGLLKSLVGDVATAASFITYGGCMNAEYRRHFLQAVEENCRSTQPTSVPHSEQFSLQKFLVTEQQVAEWQIQGLPADDHSTQSAIIVTLTMKSPMLIDPQGQGQVWLTTMHRSDGLIVTQTSTPQFLDQLQKQMRDGRPLLIEKCGSQIEGNLDNVLERRVVRTGRSMTVMLNDGAHDFNAAFKLIFTTQLANPEFDPETFAKTVVVDFTVTVAGLEQQLLSRVVRKERAEYEIQRGQLLEEINSNEKKLSLLEQKLLEKLSASQGNLIDDEGLITTLSETKIASEDIKEKLQVAADTRRRINAARAEFMPVAVRGSVTYFSAAEMSVVNHMYQTSLMSFIDQFDLSVDSSEPSKVLSQRVKLIVDRVTWDSFCAIGRGLYEMDKKIFVLLMALKVCLKARQMSPLLLRSFLVSGTALNTAEVMSKRPQTIPFITSEVWKNIVYLEETHERFGSLSSCMTNNVVMWKSWLESPNPEELKIPDFSDLSPAETLVLIRALRFDRTLVAARHMVTHVLGGDKYQSVPAFELEAVVREASPFVPIVYLLSVGTDPTSIVEALAKRYKKHLHVVSMGQGQEAEATEARAAIYVRGNWVLVQNCHLGMSYLNLLETQLDKDARSGVHPEARIWLTTQATSQFPIALLQRSIKLTNDPPQGMHAAMLRTLTWVTQDVLESSRRPEWRCILYALCFLHSTAQERCRFGPVGWCVPYEFNYSDWYASMVFIQNHIVLCDDPRKSCGAIGWDAVRYMISEIHYGGRITDSRDRIVFIQMVENLLDSSITEPTFHLCKRLQKFTIPPGDIRDHAAEQFTHSATPEIVGLHANVDVTLRHSQVMYMLGTITKAQPRTASETEGVTARDAAVRQIAVNFLEHKVPVAWSPHVVEQLLAEHGTRDPMMIVLCHEAKRLSELIDFVRCNLEEVRLGIDGSLIITASLAEVMDALHDSTVPALWRARSWESSGIGTWFEDLNRRNEQLQAWHRRGGPLGAYWLYGFFVPQAFLTSVRQSVARAHGWSLDKVEARCEMTKIEHHEGAVAPTEGVYVSGLVLDGASWDVERRRIRESPSNTMQCDLPLIHATAVLGMPAEAQAPVKSVGSPSMPKEHEATTRQHARGSHSMKVPCYCTGKRGDSNWIADVEMSVEDKAEIPHWVTRGVAILCSKT